MSSEKKVAVYVSVLILPKFTTARYVLIATEEVSSMDIFDADTTHDADVKRSRKDRIVQFFLQKFNVDLVEKYQGGTFAKVVSKTKRVLGRYFYYIYMHTCM